MSRAFVSEAAEEAKAAILPERPVSSAPNRVTPRGQALIEAMVRQLQDRLAALAADAPERAGLARDLRYWRSRAATAQLVVAGAGLPEEVGFGTRVTIRRGAERMIWHIVGEDEADPAQGLLSWTSPLAEALIGARIGEVVEPGGGRPSVIIEAIAPG
ncbi:MAG: Transcription elongation factor greB [Belnapia sp.]|jgi:transcription elongation GreA/GreB family factor|nr:Transcription elongation factor greB [Belnapia sp.]